MEEPLFVLTRPRIVVATIYTAFIGFLLAEKFWEDYCYHVKNALAWPDSHFIYNLLPLLLALILIWFSFVYGRGKLPISSSSIPTEAFFTALVLYTGWSVGLFHNEPLWEFIKSMVIFVAIVGLFGMVFRTTAKSIPNFADWMIGCIVLAIACFGYYRAVSDCLGLPQHSPVIWHLKDFINFWKDILVYVIIGAVLLQGVLRITLVIDEKGTDIPLVVRAIFFGVYAIGCLIVVAVLAGAGDLMYLNSGEFKTMSPSRQELVRFHIYLRDVFILVFAIGNSAWLYFKLFVISR